MANQQLLNEDQLKTWIMRRLGAPRIGVELHPCHLDDAVADAMDWYTAHKGFERHFFTNFFAGQVEYPYPEDADTITNVIVPEPPFDISLVFSPYILADEKIPYDVFAAPESGGIYSSLAQAIQFTETAKRVLSAEFNWFVQHDRRQIVVSPIPRHTGTMAILYKSRCFAFDQLTSFDHELMKRYALASAMMTLGFIRSKYDGLPAAQGDRRLNGERLIQMAQEEIEKLNEAIIQAGYPMPFITG